MSFLGGVPVRVRSLAENGFRMRIEEIEAAVTSRTRCIMINSPSNPTGTVLPPADLAAIAALADKHGFYVASDEIYHGLDFTGRDHTILEYTDRAFVLNGFSKLYAMTGWRLGYLVAPRAFVRPAEVIQQNFFLCANHFVQVAGVTALLQAGPDVERMREIYDERRRYLVPALRGLGLTVERRAHRGLLRVRGRASVGERLSRADATASSTRRVSPQHPGWTSARAGRDSCG